MIHRIFRPVLVLIMLGAELCHAQSTGTKSAYPILKLASDDWCPYVCVENGRIVGGFLVDITAEAMALNGYKTEPVLLPFTRAINETVSGDIQGVYSPPVDPRLRISAPIFYTRSCFYTLNKATWSYQGFGSLQGTTIGVIPDYNYDDGMFDAYVEKNKRNAALIDMAYGEFAVVSNLKKLLASRFTAIVEDEAVIARAAKKLNAENKIKQAGCLESPISVTIGFSKTDQHSEEWLKALSMGVQQLESSGRLQTLRARYQIPAFIPSEKSKQ